MRTIRNSFVTVSADCPARAGIIPATGGSMPTLPAIQYALLSAGPYRYDHEDLIWEVHRAHKDVLDGPDLAAAREHLLSRPHPCLRASALAKRYGWGAHYDAAGRIAIYGMESARYRELAASDGLAGLTVVQAMRSKRA